MNAPERPLPVATLGDAIARWARERGDAPALVGAGSPEVTFSELGASISSCAAQLQSVGLRRHDRVGLIVPPGISGGRLAVALASNATLVPLSPALTPHEIAELARASALDALVSAAPDGAMSFKLVRHAPPRSAPMRPAQEPVALLLRSSGTTGAPKSIPVTHGNLLAMAGKLGSNLWFGLGPEDRAACTGRLYYAAALKTSLFVPLILGASVAFPAAGQAHDLAKWLRVLRPTYLSVSPASLRAILDRLRLAARERDRGSLRFVMCGAAYLPEELRLAAQSLLGVPILEFYGISEAGVMAANPVPPGRTKAGTVGLPAPGELRIVDAEGRPLPHGSAGQIALSGPGVMPGYVGCGDGDFRDGWLLTGDLGRIDEDGYLTVVGRLKDVINRGGEKVFPYEIEKAMLEHPAVLEAAAFGVPHPRLGENVAAAAVLKPGSAVSEQELKRFLAARLAGFKLPRRIWFVASLPRGDTGKVQRGSLSRAYPASRPAVVAPDDLLEVELRDLWARLLGARDIGIDDDFFESGGDSLLATEMLLEVERLTGKPYPRSDLSTLTIRRIAEVVSSAGEAGHELITQVKRGAGIPLFFCHGDYFTWGIYAHKLAALLPEDQPVFLLHYYAERLRECSIEEMAGAYLDEVLRVAPDSPVFVGGWCNGGLAAWHLAHLLRARGVEVVQLILVDTLSLNAHPVLGGLARLLRSAGAVVPGAAGRFVREKAMPVAWGVWRKRGSEALRYLLRGAVRNVIRARAGHSPRGGDGNADRDAARTRQLWVLGECISRYVPPRIDIGVTCLIAENGTRFDTDPDRWRRLASNVTELSVPGTHLTAVVSERRTLATTLAHVLNRTMARCEP